MTLTFNTFESPSSGTTITNGSGSNADGSTAWATPVIGAGGTLATDTTHVVHGAQSLKVTTTSAATYTLWDSVGALGSSSVTVWGRLYFYLTANPTASWKVSQFLNATNGIFTQIVITTAGKVVQQDPSGATNVTTSTNSIAVNQPVRLEFTVTVSTTVGVQEVKLFNNWESATPTETNTATAQNIGTGSIARMRIGQCAGNAVTAWLDSPAVSDTGYPGPSPQAFAIPSIREPSGLYASMRGAFY